jgi:nucleoside-diphosphate-sugar epimerase
MKLTVFGATGGIGGHAVRQALDAGHEVSAVLREGSPFGLEHPRLTVFRVPGLTDPAVHAALLAPALTGSAAALSGLGPRGRKANGVATRMTGVVLRALQETGVRRFVAVSASPVGPPPADDGFLNSRIILPIVNSMLREVYADLTAMEGEIAASGLEWTVVRPPKLSNKALTGRYRTVIGGNVPRGTSIGRADVAHLMLATVDSPATLKQAIGIAY